jgi:hypothetical protein
VRRLLTMLMLLAAAGTAVPAASALAGTSPGGAGLQRFGVRLYDVPVSEAHNPRGLRYIIDFLPSGTVIHRRILVMNQESRTAHFTVYPDAAKIRNGMFTGDAGAARSELTSWITIQHRRLTLAPGASVLDMVTIRVPRHATRGEHYGVIWVQQVAHARNSAGVDITQVARVGIRIYLAVGPGGAPPTKFAITALTGRRTAAGRPILVARVRNTGGRAVDLSGQARLTGGPGATTAGPFPEQRIIVLAPGQADNVTFAAGKALPTGPWHAKVTLVSGFTKATARQSIQFAATATATTAAAWLHVPVMIWALVLIASVITIALFLVRRSSYPLGARRTRRTRRLRA